MIIDAYSTERDKIKENKALYIFNEDSYEKIDSNKYLLQEAVYWQEGVYKYPQRFYLDIPHRRISLEVESIKANQLLARSEFYEGGGRVKGQFNGKEVFGTSMFEEVIRIPSEELKNKMKY